jgi:hypothetical protein
MVKVKGEGVRKEKQGKYLDEEGLKLEKSMKSHYIYGASLLNLNCLLFTHRSNK